MGVLPVFVVLLCLYTLQHVAKCKAAFYTAEEVPFESICSTKCQDSENKPVEENSLPLYKCSCSRSCVMYGDCCYDSQYKDTRTRSKTDFICLHIANRGYYRVVSSCAPYQISDFCKSGIGYLPPVTSKDTGATYANIFCAKCNGDAGNLVIWNVEIRCSSNHEINTPSATDVSFGGENKIIYHFGHLWNVNLKNKLRSLCMYHVHFNDYSIIDGLELRHCYPTRKITACSASWRNLEVMNQCRSYEDPVFFGELLYKNYHCAQCNYMSLAYAQCMPVHIQIMQSRGLIDSDMISYCRQHGYQSCIQYLSGMDKGRPLAISDLMNLMSEKSCIQPGKRCCPGEWYDFRSKRCRKTVREKRKY